MSTDANPLVGSSPTSNALENLSPDQLAHWKYTGEMPGAKSSKSETAAQKETPAPSTEKESSSAAATDKGAAKPAPDSDPDKSTQQEKPKSKLSARNEELDHQIAELQSKLKKRRELRAEVEATESKPDDKKAAASTAKETSAQKQAAQTLKEKVADKITEIKNRAATYDSYEDLVADVSDAFAEALANDVVPAKVQEALDKFKADLKAEREKETQEAEISKVRTAQEEKWKSRVKASIEKHDDFVEKAFSPEVEKLIPPGSTIDRWILESDKGTEILYHLAVNSSEVKRILDLPTASEQVRELVRIEDSLSDETPVANRVSRAPKPASEVSARSTVPADDADQALRNGNFSSYRETMNAKELSKKK